MKELNPLLHSQLRLAVISILMNVEEADFVYLKEKTESGKRPRTICSITYDGRKAFEEYVEALKTYLGL